MIQSIKVIGKNNLEITFRYQMEFKQTLERLERGGKLTPSLRAMLDMLRAEEKEAAAISIAAFPMTVWERAFVPAIFDICARMTCSAPL